jgi:inner membrane protein
MASLVVPAEDRRKALVAGFALGALSDLDAVVLHFLPLDDLAKVTWHRGPTHSLFLLAALGWVLWYYSRRFRPVAEHPRRWFFAIHLALLTHPLLDCFTTYGTQIFWPLPFRPVMGSSISIVDPAYTLPLFVVCLIALFAPAWRHARAAMYAFAVLSHAYLGWTLVAQAVVEAKARAALDAEGFGGVPLVATPVFANSIRWVITAMTPGGYEEGFYSFAKGGEIAFHHLNSDTASLAEVPALRAVERLRWFTKGFLSAEVKDDTLIITDIRMGAYPFYYYAYEIARKNDGVWREVPPRLHGR